MLHPLEIEIRQRIRQDCYSTAYPWKPEDWAEYAKPGALTFKKGGNVSFYIHIPFCKNLCRFCEYTRCLVPDDDIQRNYLRILHRDIRRFISAHPNLTLEGFDIGGGTPTSLSLSNFAYLMQIYREVINRLTLSEDFEPSIETSFLTITPQKTEMIADAGIRRISVGIQSLMFSRLQGGIGWRYPKAKEIINRIHEIRNKGNFKINLDFMYGFRNQSLTDIIDSDRMAIQKLNPDQVTLYELRTNQLHDYDGAANPMWRKEYYDIYYRMLTNLGYLGQNGQNTFSVNRHDFGVSSYLRHRMLEGSDYKGFGVSAQSMSNGNVEYNIGKNSPDITGLIPKNRIPKDASFDATEHYELPDEEKFAKFVCVSAYSGGFNWRIAKERYMPNFFARFGHIIDFLVERGDIAISNDRISVTSEGFTHYGPVFSMFYKPKLITQK